ncbi:MAG TPA: phosphatase PAP2 family protein [Gemmatimonadales bacterium]|nr:phosphatase PAP2 family protein [Gemmatimonadales bacterium]
MRTLDRAILVYLALVTAVAAWRLPGNPDCGWLLLAHGLAVGLILLVRRPGLGPVGRVVREIYPAVLLVPFYSEIDILNAGHPMGHDALVQQWELAVFGEQVSQTLWRDHFPSTLASTVLHAAYWSYYLLLLAPIVWFAMRKDWLSLRRTLNVVVLTLLACYLVFIFWPVTGPYYEFARPAAWFLDNGPARLVYATLASGSSLGAAFPSSHVAATIAATSAAWRGDRRLGYTMLLPAVLLVISVVYCQMHYGVDAVTGVAIGGGAAWLGGRYRE